MGTFTITALKEYPRDCSGAGSDDMVDVGALAAEVFGDVANDEDGGLIAFAYLYRRFGAPMEGDAYKEIGMWVLTTPDPDVFLIVYPKPHDLTFCVGYLCRKSLNEEFREPVTAWFDLALGYICDEVAAEHPEWIAEYEDDGTTPKMLNDEGSKEAWGRYFKGIPKHVAEKCGPSPVERHDLPWRESKNPIRVRVNTALVASLQALTEPVYVRDVEITIGGRVGRVPVPSKFSQLRGAKGAAK